MLIMKRRRAFNRRRSEIIRELSRLSRWEHARPEDYEPLEAELRAMDR